MKNNIVYIFTNEAMPGCVKIGITDDVERRMKEVYTSGVPLSFECFYAAEVEDAALVEKKLHFAFADVRMNDRREFFRILPERVRAVLELIAIKDATPRNEVFETVDDKHAVEVARKRRPPFNFNMLGIKPESILTFSEDSKVTCRVIDAKKIEFRGKQTSLSDAAMIALREKGYSGTSYAGPDYWEYEGETLSQRRMRMEEEA
ncbi:MAG: GIY-YIG nuclease family protein [Patescibacteria group bacterium]|nr:GIY-YIG nuclease family protein [Patescibacteria group bacterium]